MSKFLVSFITCLILAGPAWAQSSSATAKTPPSSSAASMKSGQFSSESAAKAHCPGDTVVWATLSRAHAYHLSGDRYYGKTRHGAYMCKADADKAGLHQSGRRSASTSSTTKSTGMTGTTTH